MKIAITSDGDNINSSVDQRFGRCNYFLIADSGDIETVDAVKNEGAAYGHGAGIKAAQQLGTLSVKAVITGNLGPNATTVLDQLGIKAYHASGIVKDAIADYKDNKLEEICEVTAKHSGSMPKKENYGDRIFIPLLDNHGKDSKISQHFGHAPYFGVYDVEKKELKITENNLDHTDSSKSPIDQIEEAISPTVIFAKDIGGRAIDLIAEKGLSLKTGSYDTVEEVIDNLDNLEDQTKNCGHEQN